MILAISLRIGTQYSATDEIFFPELDGLECCCWPLTRQFFVTDGQGCSARQVKGVNDFTSQLPGETPCGQQGTKLEVLLPGELGVGIGSLFRRIRWAMP